MSRKSEEPNSHNSIGHIEKQDDLDMFKKTPEYKKIYHIRHKLQKLVYEKKPVSKQMGWVKKRNECAESLDI